MANKMNIKLLIDNKTQRVLFAEAGKDFVDFIFALLTLPIGFIIKLLSSESMQGSIGNLYQSVKNIDSSFLLPNKDRSSLLEPKICSSSSSSNFLLKPSSFQPKIYVCYFYKKCTTASLEKDAICTTCKGKMDVERKLIVPSVSKETKENGNNLGESGGYVKGVITYMITDNLEVTPLSAISSITLINKYGVNNGGVDLTEKMVQFGEDQGLALLKVSLQSKKVLTEVFLKKASKSPN